MDAEHKSFTVVNRLNDIRYMRLFEIILSLTVTILPFTARPLKLRVEPACIWLFIGIVITLHLFTEGWRWQMVPAYFLVLFLGWRVYAIDVSKPRRLSLPGVAGFLGISILVITGWILPAVFPVFSLPEPRGPYSVGTEMVYLQSDRDEVITEDPGDRRERMLKIWYPSRADVSDMKGERYIDRGSRAGFATKYGLPPATFNYLDRVETYAYPDIAAANERFPILIFSHGYGSKATGYYALLTELASQGYVIVNMNHTYESLGVTYPDGRISYFDYEYQREISAGSMEYVKPLSTHFKMA